MVWDVSGSFWLFPALSGSFRHFSVVSGTFHQFPAFSGNLRHFSVVSGTFRKFTALLASFRHFQDIYGTFGQFPALFISGTFGQFPALFISGTFVQFPAVFISGTFGQFPALFARQCWENTENTWPRLWKIPKKNFLCLSSEISVYWSQMAKCSFVSLGGGEFSAKAKSGSFRQSPPDRDGDVWVWPTQRCGFWR